MSDVIETTHIIPEWCNKDLEEYYDNVPIEELVSFTKIGGIYNCCDLDLVQDYIKAASNILEIGGGFGRVVNYLYNTNPDAKITAIERCKRLFNHLYKLYSDKVNMINSDLLDFESTEKYNLVLMMWSGLVEYPKVDQSKVLEKLKSFLSDSGILIIETLSHKSIPKNVTNFDTDKRSYIVKTSYGNAYGYIPTDEEIRQYAIHLGFKCIKQIPYISSSNVERLITVMS
jgi:phospholipid N-methyltransferase